MAAVHTPPIPFFIPAHLRNDHLLEDCPALQRVEPWPPGSDGPAYWQGDPSWFHLPSPNPGDVCGWCTRVWIARNRGRVEPCDCGVREDLFRRNVEDAKASGRPFAVLATGENAGDVFFADEAVG